MAAGYSYNPLVRHSCSKGLGRLRQPRQPVIDPALKLFNEWIRANEKNGLWMHDSLTWVFNESSDFGIAAPWTDGLNNGETIVKVPKSLILSPHTVSNPEFRQILKENTNLDPMCKLAVAYIFESCLREMSPFFGYLSYITFPDVPRLWDDDELKLLRGTEVEIPYQKSKNYLDDLFRTLVSPFLWRNRDLFHPRLDYVTYKVWREAYITVESRAFHVDHYLALVPICDVFNHAASGEEDLEFLCGYEPCDICESTNPCNCYALQVPSDMAEIETIDPKGAGWVTIHAAHAAQRLQPELDCCTMALVKDITTIKQLFNNYGHLSNPQLLMTYGFLDYNCPYDRVSLYREVFLDPALGEAHSELCLFWSVCGLNFLKEVAKNCTGREREEMESLFSEERYPYSNHFPSWSLAIGEDGWVHFPLKVWGVLCTMSSFRRDHFLKSPPEDQVEFMRQELTNMFDPTDNTVDLLVVEWIKWLLAALEKRQERLAINNIPDLNKAIGNLQKDDVLGRKEKVLWVLKRELTMLINCRRLAEETLELMGERKDEMDLHWEHLFGKDLPAAKRRKVL